MQSLSDSHEVRNAASQPIKLGDDERITLPQIIKRRL
jgi:hypothetical protein